MFISCLSSDTHTEQALQCQNMAVCSKAGVSHGMPNGGLI